MSSGEINRMLYACMAVKVRRRVTHVVMYDVPITICTDHSSNFLVHLCVYNTAHTTSSTITRDSNNTILLHNVLLVVIMIHFTSASPDDFNSEAADVRDIVIIASHEFIISRIYNIKI